MDFSLINKEYIRTHEFTTDGVSYRTNTEDVNYRLRQGDGIPKLLEENYRTLRLKFVSLFDTYFDLNYKKLESRTGITEDAMRKYLRKEKGRRISRMAVAKMVIGIPLPYEEANVLFRMEGHSLEPESALLDAIVVDALNCGDDIATFYETCSEFKIKT